MYGFKEQRKKIDACAARLPDRSTGIKRDRSITDFTCAIALLASFLLPVPTHAAVNVFPATPALQTQFLAATTNQWLGTVTPSLFPGSVNFSLTGPNPDYMPPQPSMVIFDTTTFTNMMAMIVIASSDSYVNGWSNGMAYERFHDLVYIGNFYGLCNSTSTFNLPNISSGTCQAVTATISNFIYQLNFSSPTVVPGF